MITIHRNGLETSNGSCCQSLASLFVHITMGCWKLAETLEKGLNATEPWQKLWKRRRNAAANLWTSTNMKTKWKCIAKPAQGSLNHFSWQLFFLSRVVFLKWPTFRDVLYASTHKYNNVFVYLVSVSNKLTLIPPQRVPLAHFILTSR